MSEMVDRVARALYAHENGSSDGWEGPLLAERGREMWRKQARAAIKAMREPTSEMLYGEPCMAQGISYVVPVIEIWPKMIDAALGDKAQAS